MKVIFQMTHTDLVSYGWVLTHCLALGLQDRHHAGHYSLQSDKYTRLITAELKDIEFETVCSQKTDAEQLVVR